MKTTDHPKPWRCEPYGPGHEIVRDANGGWVAQMLKPEGELYTTWANARDEKAAPSARGSTSCADVWDEWLSGRATENYSPWQLFEAGYTAAKNVGISQDENEGCSLEAAQAFLPLGYEIRKLEPAKTYWLLEAKHYDPRRYLSIPLGRGSHEWITDPTKAYRFKTKQDADKQAEYEDEACDAFEHMDCATSPADRAAAGSIGDMIASESEKEEATRWADAREREHSAMISARNEARTAAREAAGSVTQEPVAWRAWYEGAWVYRTTEPIGASIEWNSLYTASQSAPPEKVATAAEGTPRTEAKMLQLYEAGNAYTGSNVAQKLADFARTLERELEVKRLICDAAIGLKNLSIKRAEAAESDLKAANLLIYEWTNRCAEAESEKEAAVLAEREAIESLCISLIGSGKTPSQIATMIRARTGVPNDR